jgi:signal transduction histidine kinase
MLEIGDDGPGMPLETQRNLFTPSASDGTGHGLGLPLSKRLVELLGGELSLKKTDSSGTKFLVRLSGRHVPTTMPPPRP